MYVPGMIKIRPVEASRKSGPLFKTRETSKCILFEEQHSESKRAPCIGGGRGKKMGMERCSNMFKTFSFQCCHLCFLF